jgi:hypothetical protein
MLLSNSKVRDQEIETRSLYRRVQGVAGSTCWGLGLATPAVRAKAKNPPAPAPPAACGLP